MLTKGPKSLLEYNGTTVLDHQIRTIRKVDSNADICVVLGFHADKIIKHILNKKYDIRIVLNQNFKITSQTESLRFGINAIRETDYYIIHGDIIFNEQSLKLKKDCSKIVIDKTLTEKKIVGVSHSNGELLHLSFGLEDKWSQIAYICRDDFALSRRVINSFKMNKMTYEFLNMLGSHIPFRIHSEKVKTVEILKNYENISNQ